MQDTEPNVSPQKPYKAARMDRTKPKTYAALTFGWLRRLNENREVPVLITRVDGNDVYYRTIREDRGWGAEQVIHARSDSLRPALKKEFQLVIQRGEAP